MAKGAKSKVSKTGKQATSLPVASQPKKQNKPSLKVVAAPSPETNSEVASTGKSQVAQRLAASLEKRKLEKQGAVDKNGKPSFFGRPPGRRGRRPKAAAEYTPSQQEEDSYAMEPEFEALEYDTGIRVKEGGDDGLFSFDRSEDFDEELNFDP